MKTVIDPSATPLMAAVEENLLYHVAYVQRHEASMSVEELEDLVIVDSGLESDTFNKILGARISEERVYERIDQALSHFRRARRPFTWWVGPCSRPLDLEARLREKGLEPFEYELGMTIELAKMPARVDAPPRSTIERVTTLASTSDFASVLTSLGQPPDRAVVDFFEKASALVTRDDGPMKLYVAYVDGRPAATSELFLTGELAGVHMVATSPEFRRRGLGMAMTWAALDEARRLGATTGALQSSEEGRRVYERLGFRPCGCFVEYGIA